MRRQPALGRISAIGIFCFSLALFFSAPSHAARPIAPTFSVLADFGAGPDVNGIVSAGDGSYYITTSSGGSQGSGAIYKFTSGSGPVLFYDFADSAGAGGELPQDSVILDDAGNLYGTTVVGGNFGCTGNTCGVIFKLSPNAIETVLYAFPPSQTNGAFPERSPDPR